MKNQFKVNDRVFFIEGSYKKGKCKSCGGDICSTRCYRIVTSSIKDIVHKVNAVTRTEYTNKGKSKKREILNEQIIYTTQKGSIFVQSGEDSVWPSDTLYKTKKEANKVLKEI